MSLHIRMSGILLRHGWVAFAFAAGLLCPELRSSEAPAADTPSPVVVKVCTYYDPNRPDGPTTKRLIELMRRDKDIRITAWGGLSLPGGAGRAPLMMAIAGRTAPDIMESWFHIIGNDIRQGFLHPLNEWIGDDEDGDGRISDAEAKWDGWKRIPPLWRQVATHGGKVYGLPEAAKYYLGVIYRVDMVRAAGLDPNDPPSTWDELIYWCQRLTDPAKEVPGATIKEGQRGIALYPNGYTWLPWMQSAGGDPIVQLRRSPKTGKEYVLPPDTTDFTAPDGEDLSRCEPTWRADFASEAGVEAVGLYHRLRWMKWMVDPETKEPVNLSEEDLKNGYAMVGDRKLPFQDSDVINGVARGCTGQRGTDSVELLARGEVALAPGFVLNLDGLGGGIGIDPALLSWFPFPAKSKTEGRQVVQVQVHYADMTEGVGIRPKRERDKVWEALTAVTDQAVADDTVRRRVLSGLSRFVNPQDLKRLGFDDYLKDVPMVIRRNFERIDNGEIATYTEPYMGFWVTMDTALNTRALSLVLSEAGEHFDYASALREVEHDANTGLMFGRSEEDLNKYRPTARIVFLCLAALMAVCLVLIVRSLVGRRGKAASRQVHSSVVPWLIMLPALLLVGLWSYYPLLRGMFMAFQDYHIAGKSAFIGLDNFISLALDASFWMSLWRTVVFVFLNMILAFTAPILIALLLSEIPRGKYLYRTLFFLPQITSGLVIALLWKLMYDPTPQGFLNQLISCLNYLPFVHVNPQTWLQDPKLAMVCCVIPTVWATMGMASLIYLAALKGVPEEIYEAADLDGAGVWTKLVKVTFPTLMPLIIINFVGAFIGTFQNMGNIFLMTFGGPGESTMVVGLKIWIEAYNNLRFSMATSMAWVLGSLLIGFTYFQIQLLKKVEFKKAEWD